LAGVSQFELYGKVLRGGHASGLRQRPPDGFVITLSTPARSELRFCVSLSLQPALEQGQAVSA
jgi:hypothetical protein